MPIIRILLFIGLGLVAARGVSAIPAADESAPVAAMEEVAETAAVLAVGYAATGLPDFSVYGDVSTKKSRFFRYLLPLVNAENKRLTAIRKRLNYIYDHVRWHREVSAADGLWLASLGSEFRLQQQSHTEAGFWQAALERVDAVPEDLVLVQAANESAWGTSRFAREGNNLFGQWCFRPGCGMVPLGRPADATYEVARFASVTESIGSYMHNLNTGKQYQTLREIRAKMRFAGQDPDAAALAIGLQSYSTRGMDYVNELRAMIRHNEQLLDDLRQTGATDGNS